MDTEPVQDDLNATATEEPAVEEGETIAYELPTGPEGKLVWDDVTDEDLASLRETVFSAFQAEQGKDTADVDLDLLQNIGQHFGAITAETDRRVEELALKKEQIAELNKQIAANDPTWSPGDNTDPNAETGEEGTPAETGEEGETGETGEEGDPAPETGEEGEGGEPAPEKAKEEPVPASAKVRVPASAKKLTTRKVNSSALPSRARLTPFGNDSGSNRPSLSLVASSNVNEFDFGGELGDLRSIAEKMRNHAIRNGRTQQSNAYLARIVREQPSQFVFDGGQDDQDKWDDFLAWKPTVQELTASSGCGPCETVYDYCDLSQVGELVKVPERQFTRGSICFPESIDIKDIIDQLCENICCYDPDVECVKIPIEFDCPGPRNEITICARFLSMKFNNFVARSNPELYEDAIRKALKAHQIMVHLDTLRAMLNDPFTEECDLTAGNYPDGAASGLLTQIEFLVEMMRSKYCMGSTAGLEAIMPRWVRSVVRADMARANSMPDYNVSNEMIGSWFASRGARVQFVDYWQQIPGDCSSLDFPGTFKALFYPAGTFIRGTQGTLDLGNEIRTQEDIEANCYRSFVEDFYATGSVCDGALIATLNSCATGARGENVAIDCNGPWEGEDFCPDNEGLRHPSDLEVDGEKRESAPALVSKPRSEEADGGAAPPPAAE